MKTAYFLRGAPYEYKVNELNLYESFDELATCRADPPILDDRSRYKKQLEEKVDLEDCVVLSSPDKRSAQTAELLSKKPRKMAVLREIQYSMSQVITEKEFFSEDGTPDVTKARIGFVNALTHDHLEERYGAIIGRIKRILAEIRAAKSNNVVVISHGFLLKVLESYIRDNSIAKRPDRLSLYFDGKCITYGFLSGFQADIQKGKLIFSKYI